MSMKLECTFLVFSSSWVSSMVLTQCDFYPVLFLYGVDTMRFLHSALIYGVDTMWFLPSAFLFSVGSMWILPGTCCVLWRCRVDSRLVIYDCPSHLTGARNRHLSRRLGSLRHWTRQTASHHYLVSVRRERQDVRYGKHRWVTMQLSFWHMEKRVNPGASCEISPMQR